MKILEMLQAWVNLHVSEKYNKAVESDEMRKILYYEGVVHGVRALLAELGISMAIIAIKEGPFERKLISCKLAFFQND